MRKFFAEEEGQTMVEYALLVSLIALIVIGVLALVGRRLRDGFGVANNSLSTATT